MYVMLQQTRFAPPVPNQALTTAIMAEANERDKSRAPRSRWRADGRRRRTKGERAARAPHAAHWKERQRQEREARRELNEPAPSADSHKAEWWYSCDYDADNNWWNYEWVCHEEEQGAASSSWRRQEDKDWWQEWQEDRNEDVRESEEIPETPPPAPKAQKCSHEEPVDEAGETEGAEVLRSDDHQTSGEAGDLAQKQALP